MTRRKVTSGPPPLANPVTTQDVDYTPEELRFMRAVEDYRKQNRRRYVTWREVLRVAHALGYRRVAPVDELPRFTKRPSG
jgi:hypothetical protein